MIFTTNQSYCSFYKNCNDEYYSMILNQTQIQYRKLLFSLFVHIKQKSKAIFAATLRTLFTNIFKFLSSSIYRKTRKDFKTISNYSHESSKTRILNFKTGRTVNCLLMFLKTSFVTVSR